MDKKAQYDLMEKIVRELDDLQNSQTAVLKKISQIEADNINLSNKALEDSLSELFSSIDTSLEAVTKLRDTFREETDKFKTNNKLDQMPDLGVIGENRQSGKTRSVKGGLPFRNFL